VTGKPASLRVTRSDADDNDDVWHLTLVELLDGDGWRLADALLNRYSLEDYPAAGATKTGLYHALLEDVEILRKQYGIVTKHQYLATVRNTAIAWPPEDREPTTSFMVHYRMRGKNRHAEMQKRLRQAKREKFPLNENMLARYRADERPMSMRPYREKLDRAIAAAVKRQMLGGTSTKREDWWMAQGITDAARGPAVDALRALASAIAKGEK